MSKTRNETNEHIQIQYNTIQYNTKQNITIHHKMTQTTYDNT